MIQTVKLWFLYGRFRFESILSSLSRQYNLLSLLSSCKKKARKKKKTLKNAVALSSLLFDAPLSSVSGKRASSKTFIERWY